MSFIGFSTSIIIYLAHFLLCWPLCFRSQEKLLGLMSLPTKDKYEALKEKRKQEQEKKLQQERLVRSNALFY